MKCVVDRYKWHRPFQMATTVLRNGNDRLRKGNLRRRQWPQVFFFFHVRLSIALEEKITSLERLRALESSESALAALRRYIN